MKIACLLAFLVVGILHAENPIAQNYGHEAEIGQGYSFRNNVLWVQPYQYEPVWFKGIYTQKNFEMRAGEHFFCIREENYDEFIFNGHKQKQISFTRKTFSYTLGPENHQKRKILRGAQLGSENFQVPEEYFLLIDYRIFLETRPGQKFWKTKGATRSNNDFR